MAYKDLQDFINTLKERNELLEIDFPVSSELEITEITDRSSKNIGLKNNALLFKNVEGYDIPVLTNAFGSFERMAASLGVNNVKEIAARIEELIKPEIPDSLVGKAALLPKLLEVCLPLFQSLPKSIEISIISLSLIYGIMRTFNFKFYELFII